MSNPSPSQVLRDFRCHPHEENRYVDPSMLLSNSTSIRSPAALPVDTSSHSSYQPLQPQNGFKSDNFDCNGSVLAVDTLKQECELPFCQKMPSSSNITHYSNISTPNYPLRTLSVFDRVTLEEIQSSINTLTGDVTRMMESHSYPIDSIAEFMRLQTLALESQQKSEALFDGLRGACDQDDAHADLMGLMSKLTSVKTQSALIHLQLQNPRNKWRSSRIKQIGDQASKIYELTRQLKFNLDRKDH